MFKLNNNRANLQCHFNFDMRNDNFADIHLVKKKKT